MVMDNASLAVISQTRPEHLNYVRLYFRPRTPTQFRNEGIRPLAHRWRPDLHHPSVHCAIPVFFCFDAATILAADSTEFSNGNMGSAYVEHGNSQALFQRIPFHNVFHHGPMPLDKINEIKFNRCAEVLVPESLPLLPGLRMIACRSSAERQTLLHLLPNELRPVWTDMIRLGYEGLFERRWTFVESLSILSPQVTFNFNPSTTSPGPFNVKFHYQESGSTTEALWMGQLDGLKDARGFRISGSPVSGEVQLYLDDCLAYADDIIFTETPF
jgi:hypothetical protein